MQTDGTAARCIADSAKPLGATGKSAARCHHRGSKNGKADATEPLRRRLHSLQPAKGIEWANGDQFEAHEMSLAERQLFEHFVGGCRVGHIQYEHHAPASL